MEQPTKERALQILEDLKILKKDNPEPEFDGLFNMLNYAWTTYLALMDEVEEIDLLYKGLERMSATDKRAIQQLEAENQALKADNALLDVKLRELRIEYRKLEAYLAEKEGVNHDVAHCREAGQKRKKAMARLAND